jgi:DNA segregation ATPase FtsK/SpoIIIE, S-DNA-T family
MRREKTMSDARDPSRRAWRPGYRPVFVVEPEPVPEKTWRERLSQVQIGRKSNGEPWCLRLIDSHVLIAGVTGAGKGSVAWSAVVSLAAALIAGVAQVWGLDPKRMELSIGRSVFEHYASDSESMVALLEQAVELMHERTSTLAGQTRKFEPSAQTPLIVIVVDELGYLSALLPDRDLKKKADQALNTLLILGRSVGFSVVGAIQDPRKETLNNRDLFPTRVAMRLPAEMVNLVLGREAYQEGARCDQIPLGDSGAGSAYVVDETTAVPTYVRASWQSDEAIREWAEWLERIRLIDGSERADAIAIALQEPAPARPISTLRRLGDVALRRAEWRQSLVERNQELRKWRREPYE